MYNILIVEDDRTIAGAMKKHIDAWGFNARCAEDFRNIMEEFADFNPQLVLLDISLPFFNGYHWCSEIRKVSKVPIIFMTIPFRCAPRHQRGRNTSTSVAASRYLLEYV